MLRFKILASTIPVILASMFAGSELLPARRPCITLGETAFQITPNLRQAQLHVSFTSDPAMATVRVQMVDNAEAADFAYVDDDDSAEVNGCEVAPAPRLIGITEKPSAAGPVIYLSPAGNTDYRIYVQSKRFSAREAAALIVGASDPPAHISAAAL